MKKINKKSLIILSIFIFIIFFIFIFKGVNTAAINTFSIGTNAQATYNSATKELIIESTNGTTGQMTMAIGYELSNNIDVTQVETVTFRNQIKAGSILNLFSGMENLTKINNLSYLDTSSTTSMSYMFFCCKKLTSLDVSSLNTSNVTDFSRMFGHCEALVSLDLSSFNTQNATDFSYMFEYCESLTSLNVTSFNTQNATDFSCMFEHCESLTSLNVSSFNTQNVVDMSHMFYYCESLTSLNVSSFNTSNVTDFSYMFAQCRKLTSLNLSNFNTSNVTDFSYMFVACEALTGLNISNFNTSQATNFKIMFGLCNSLQTLDISSFDMRGVTSNNKDEAELFFMRYPLIKHIYTPSQYSTFSTSLPGTFKNVTDASDTNYYTSFSRSTFTGSKHLTRIYVITYNANGGSGSDVTQNQEYDQSITIRNNTFTAPANKMFDKWNTNEDGSGTSYNPGVTNTFSEDITLYAQWKDIEYTVIFKDRGTVLSTQTVIKGQNATAPSVTARAGYTYTWDKSYTNVQQDLTVNVVWTPNTNTPYKVEHYKEEANGSYARDDSLTENKTGTTDTTATATAKTIAGYTEDTTNSNRVASGTIAGNGSLVLKLYYKANTNTAYKVEHYKEQANGSFTKDDSLTENKTGKTGATVTATPKTIAGFTEDTTNSNRVASGTIAGDGSLVLKLYYKANTNTAYKVEHYKEQANGSFTRDDSLTENKSGKTGTTVTATAKTIIGYTEDTTNSNRVASGTVAADGSLVLKLYYKANTDTAYTVEHYIEQPNGNFVKDDTLTENKTGKTGATVTATPKTITGYTEDTTNQNRVASGTVAGNGSLVLKLYYKANTDTAYKVEYYKEQADGTFAKDDTLTENKSGKTGATVNATAKTITGYIEDTTNENRVASGTIAANGSLVLKLYYKANTDTAYTVEHYKEQANGSYAKDDTLTENKTGKTGTTVSATAKTIAGFTEDLSNENRVVSGTVAADGSLVLKLFYKANTNTEYKEEYYLEQPDGSYSKDDTLTENLRGKTGATVNIEIKTIAGFTEDTSNSNRVPSGTIKADGSLVLKLYYKANTDTGYKVEYYFENPDGTFVKDDALTENKTGKTGQEVSAEVKTIDGYTVDLDNQDALITSTIAGDGSLVLKVYYNANTNTEYKVEYYKEQPDGTFAKDDTLTENLRGKTGSEVTAEVKELAGYTEDDKNTERIASGIISGDGSLVLKLYYKANTNISYKIEHYLEQPDGVFEKDEKLTENKVGKTSTIATAIAKKIPGYTEDTSNKDRAPSGIISADGKLVLKLYYKANLDTKYKIEYYLEQLDGSFKVDEKLTETKTAITGETVSVTAKQIEGYVEYKETSSKVTSGIVKGDGSLVLKLYYKKIDDTKAPDPIPETGVSITIVTVISLVALASTYYLFRYRKLNKDMKY